MHEQTNDEKQTDRDKNVDQALEETMTSVKRNLTSSILLMMKHLRIEDDTCWRMIKEREK